MKTKKKLEDNVKFKLFKEGDQVYYLHYSPRARAFYFPLKVEILGIGFRSNDKDFPFYNVKVLDYYDTESFMKKYFLFERFNLVSKKISYSGDLNSLSRETKKSNIIEFLNDPRNYIQAPSFSCFETKKEMIEVFNEIQDYTVRDLFIEVSEIMSRKIYSGLYKISYRSYILDRLKDILSKGMTKFDWEFITKLNRREYNSKPSQKNIF